MAQAAKYNYNQPVFSAQTGSFTQVVWKNTSQITLTIARCPAGAILPAATIYVVARYTPPGNVAGYFPMNVGRPR